MSQAQSNFDRVYPVDPATLYDALRAALADGKYRKVTTDGFTRTAGFKSPATRGAWGQLWQAQALPTDHGTVLRLTSAGYQTFGANGISKDAMKIAERLFSDVSRRCAAAVA